DQRAHDREAEAGTTGIAAARFIRAIEAIEHGAELLRLQAIAGVDHGDEHYRVLNRARDANLAAVRRMSKRIAQQIMQHLAHAHPVQSDSRQVSRSDAKRDAALLGQWREELQRFADQLREISRLERKWELPRIGQRKVTQIVDQTNEMACLSI